MSEKHTLPYIVMKIRSEIDVRYIYSATVVINFIFNNMHKSRIMKYCSVHNIPYYTISLISKLYYFNIMFLQNFCFIYDLNLRVFLFFFF